MNKKALVLFAVLAIVFVATMPNVWGDTTTGLVCYLDLDEGAGEVAVDSSGENNHGVLSGCTWDTGLYSGGLLLDGVNDQVALGTESSLDILTNFSVAMWIKPYSISGYHVYASKSEGGLGSTQWELRGNDDALQLCVSNGSMLFTAVKQGLVNNSWTFVVGTISNNVMNVYINGSVGSSDTITGTQSSSALDTLVGARNGDGLFYSGVVDEVRIYNRSLSESDIAELMAYDPTPTATPTATPTIGQITEKMNLTLVLLFLIVFNVALILAKRPILSIVVGLFSIAIAALSFQTGYTVIFQGYLQAMLFFVTIASMLISFKVTR